MTAIATKGSTAARLWKAAGVFLRRYPADALGVAVSDRLRILRVSAVAPGRHRILVQGVEDPYYLALFGHLVSALRKRSDVSVDLFVSRSINAVVGVGWKELLLRSFPLQHLAASQWARLYAPVVDRVGYRSASPDHPLGDLVDLVRSYLAWRRLTTPRALEALEIDGIIVGDLVLDSYLRFRPSPRMALGDWFLLQLVWQAHRDYRRARHYFRTERPRLYLTSYTTYIQHGVALRVALREGVSAVSFGNLQELGKRLTADDVYHTRNPLHYRRDFERLDDKPARIAEAAQQLELRLSGGIDAATAYMASSAYAVGREPVPDVRGAVVIFLHDFYDSPHVYADLAFPEFWSWICYTIETLQAAGIPFFVKPHPNQIAISDAVLDQLRARYPAVSMLSSGITNRQLVEGGMVCGVTAYGTVAHELAYLGVPTIACARHPHVAFDFCLTAKDPQTYAGYLRRATKLDRDPARLRTEALQFYYMHNLALDAPARALRDAMIACWRACHTAGASADEILRRFDELVALPGFDAFVEDLVRTFGLGR